MTYIVQKGETIRQVTSRLGCSFGDLRRRNPEAIGRTVDGRWYLKAGAELSDSAVFSDTLSRFDGGGKTMATPVIRDSAQADRAEPAASSGSKPAAEAHSVDRQLLAGLSPHSKELMTAILNRAKAPKETPAPVAAAESPAEVGTPSRTWRLSELKIEGGRSRKSEFAEDLNRTDPNPGPEGSLVRVKSALSPGLDLSLSVTRRGYTNAIGPAATKADGDTAVSFGLVFKF